MLFRVQIILFILLINYFSSKGQIITSDEMPRALYYYKLKKIEKFSEMQNMKDIFHCDKYLMGRNIFSGNVSNNFGRVMVDDGKSLNEEFRYSVGLFLRTMIFEEYSLNTTFFKHFNQRSNVRWLPDFTYSIGRYHWKPHTFNFGYENYGPNKYSENGSQLFDRFRQGFYFISYAHFLSDNLTKKIWVDESTNVRFTYFVRYATHYLDHNYFMHGGLFSGKPYAGFMIRYTIASRLYVESSIHTYFNAERNKQAWDPDYSYGFGYFDYRPFRVSFTYANWEINKFPWNKDQNPFEYYGFLDGTFRINFNWSW